MQVLLMFSYKALRQTAAAALFALSVTTVTTGCDTLTNLVISNEQEVAIGEEVDKQIRAEFTLLADTDPASIWANDLVQQMVPASAQFRKPSDIGEYKVKVIYDNSLVNAFAAPGGYIYIVSGLVLTAGNCAEVAGVVGHELAHVTQRHSVKKIAQSSAALGLSDIVLNEGITQSVAEGIYGFLLNTTFSRKDEKESDKVGTQIIYETGYNPYALAHMFQNLADLSAGNEPPRFLSSHPLSKDRVAAIENQIESSWPGQVQEYDDPALTYDCLLPAGSTSASFEAVKTHLRTGTVTFDLNSNQNPTAPTTP